MGGSSSSRASSTRSGGTRASLAVGRHFELVALGGTAKPTVEKFRTLRELGAGVVYLALDARSRWREAAAAVACRCAWEAGVEVGVLSMPEDCKDPDEVLTRYGPSDGGATSLHARPRRAGGDVARARTSSRGARR